MIESILLNVNNIIIMPHHEENVHLFIFNSLTSYYSKST